MHGSAQTQPRPAVIWRLCTAVGVVSARSHHLRRPVTIRTTP